MNANEPAFPSPALDRVAEFGCSAGPVRGMSLRAYLAGKALQGQMSRSAELSYSPETIAQTCLRHTDALIAELNKETNK